MKLVQIITTDPVIKDKKGNDCFLIRSIASASEALGSTTFVVRTDYCQVDENGKAINLHQCDNSVSFNVTDELRIQVTAQLITNLPNGLNEAEREHWLRQQFLLADTISPNEEGKQFYGIAANKWQVYNN